MDYETASRDSQTGKFGSDEYSLEGFESILVEITGQEASNSICPGDKVWTAVITVHIKESDV